MKVQITSYGLALALCFSAAYANAQSTGQAQQSSPQKSSPGAGTNGAGNSSATPAKQLRSPDVVFVPTPYEAVDAMLKVAKVGKGDIVYDLGSGDGRIPIMAVQKYNAARAVGIDINPDRIKEAQANLEKAGVGDRVRFLNEDLFEANISEATVVTLYLLPSLNLKLIPKLLSELKPGTRIASHSFDMGSWKPERTLNVNGSTVHYWTIPAKGTSEYSAASKAAAAGKN